MLDPSAPASWTVGVDVSGNPSTVEGLWLRRQWRLLPDDLAQVGLQGGVRLVDPGGATVARGWLGAYVGLRWLRDPWIAELGTGLGVHLDGGPAGWQTAASVGVAW